MAKRQLRILAIGAHPDDCDLKCGGMAIMYAKRGHAVKFVSVTNGNAGHYLMGGGLLAARRAAEARAAAKVAGIAYEVLDNNDGALVPSLDNRKQIIRLIREFRPDLVITHRPNDYHPDHRYTSQLVQDAAYMVTVPNVVPLTPHLSTNPVMAYMSDGFQKPYPFSADVAVGTDEVIDAKLRMLACHESQFFEWLPYNCNVKTVPSAPAARLKWLRAWKHHDLLGDASRFRAALVRLYGRDRGERFKHAEALEIGEYGTPLDKRNLHTLFPFFR